jgi:GNAT superfamily N-acetyltransferase
MLAIRAMLPSDIPAAHVIRLRVRENQLSDPSVVTEQDYHDLMARDTMSWVCNVDGILAGFVMVDVEKQNLWALFVAPEHEFKGIGRALHVIMIEQYFTKANTLRLSTAPKTRAEAFYKRAGYNVVGETKSGEVMFEIDRTSIIPR